MPSIRSRAVARRTAAGPSGPVEPPRAGVVPSGEIAPRPARPLIYDKPIMGNRAGPTPSRNAGG